MHPGGSWLYSAPAWRSSKELSSRCMARWCGCRWADETLVVASRRRLNWEGGTPAAARLVVGDRVAVEMRGEDGVIVAVHARRNSLLRRAPSKNRAQILAANVDQAFVVFAAREPAPKQGLVDRFLVACELAGIRAVITINKLDQGLDDSGTLAAGLRGAGLSTSSRVSARTGWGLGTVKRLLVDRTDPLLRPLGRRQVIASQRGLSRLSPQGRRALGEHRQGAPHHLARGADAPALRRFCGRHSGAQGVRGLGGDR